MNRLTEEVQIGPFAALKDKAEAVPGAFGTYDCFYAHEMAVTRLKKYEDTGLEPEEIEALVNPPNPPLTLEELREMDGEPVWLSFLDINRKESHYVMFCGLDKHGNRAHFYNEISRSLDDYGKIWLAYRRKPEEGQSE